MRGIILNFSWYYVISFVFRISGSVQVNCISSWRKMKTDFESCSALNRQLHFGDHIGISIFQACHTICEKNLCEKWYERGIVLPIWRNVVILKLVLYNLKSCELCCEFLSTIYNLYVYILSHCKWKTVYYLF